MKSFFLLVAVSLFGLTVSNAAGPSANTAIAIARYQVLTVERGRVSNVEIGDAGSRRNSGETLIIKVDTQTGMTWFLREDANPDISYFWYPLSSMDVKELAKIVNAKK